MFARHALTTDLTGARFQSPPPEALLRQLLPSVRQYGWRCEITFAILVPSATADCARSVLANCGFDAPDITADVRQALSIAATSRRRPRWDALVTQHGLPNILPATGTDDVVDRGGTDEDPLPPRPPAPSRAGKGSNSSPFPSRKGGGGIGWRDFAPALLSGHPALDTWVTCARIELGCEQGRMASVIVDGGGRTQCRVESPSSSRMRASHSLGRE